MQQNCPNCNYPVQAGQPQCQHCGYNLAIQNQPAPVNQPGQAPMPANPPMPNQPYNPDPVGNQQSAPNGYYNQGQVPTQPNNPAYPNQPQPQMQQAPGYDQQQPLQQQPNYSFDGKPSNKKKIFIIVGIIGGVIILVPVIVIVVGLLFLGSKVRVALAVTHLEEAGMTCEIVEDVEGFEKIYESTLDNISEPQRKNFRKAFSKHEYYLCYGSTDEDKEYPTDVMSVDLVKRLTDTVWQIGYDKSFAESCRAEDPEDRDEKLAQESKLDYTLFDRQVVIERVSSSIMDKLEEAGLEVEEDVPTCKLY